MKPQDWYTVSFEEIRTWHGCESIYSLSRLVKDLKQIYPHHEWQDSTFLQAMKRSTQKRYERILRATFPLIHSLFFDAILEGGQSFDLFIPSLSLALEYQVRIELDPRFNLFFF